MSFSFGATRSRLQPPFADQPLDEKGRYSQAWTRHQQDVVDALHNVGTGVSDGSDAAAGHIGEYLSAGVIFPGVALAGGGAAADVTNLALTAGDWDVTGSVIFSSSAANLVSVVASVSATSATITDPGMAAINTNAGTTRFTSGTRLVAGPVRFNLGAAGTAFLVASATFPAGVASAYGHIGARRIR